MSIQRFDDVFAAFNEIATSMQSGRLLEMVLVTNCSMLFFKMGKLLRAAELEHIADRSLLIRLERMLDDFREDSACRPIRLQTEIVHAETWLRGLVAEIKKDVHAEDDIFETLDDEKAFVQALARRIAFRPIYRDVDIAVTATENLWIEADPGRLAECVEIIFECMLEAGNKQIMVNASQQEPELIRVAINGDRLPAALLGDSYQKRGLVRRLKWLGGRLVVDSRQDAPRLMVMVPAPMNRTDV